MKNRFTDRLLRLFSRKRHQSPGPGGVDAGRDSFVRLAESEKRKRIHLLRKLNIYWSKRRENKLSSYQGEQKGGGRLRVVLLVLGFVVAMALFLGNGGLERVAHSLEDVDYFRITAIEVQGCISSAPDAVRNSSGVTVSQSLITVDSQRVSEVVKQENPWVKGVKVIKQWADSLLIKVSEYEPHALIAVDSKDRVALHYLDRNGDPFIRVKKGMELDFPVITGLETVHDPEQRSERLKQPLYFLRLVSANNPNLPAQSVSEVHLDDQEGLIVYLVEHPFPIFLGHGEIRQKYVRLRKVLEVLYKPRKLGMDIARVAYIRMDYLKDKVIVGYTESG